ncbi:hypothetical protein [Pseudoalteromonas umbrosa]|uniref:hypothetical protein n=1 Tax=Pseudoalteromonas umbrosa TaxID=3048489 RepID=UPI0024C390D7|nr:hypothetical protein [Pseudoalteromonas sp. B95]MDK1290723.1 hypothetical protein [Pseudoalteromonas sp. B95]
MNNKNIQENRTQDMSKYLSSANAQLLNTLESEPNLQSYSINLDTPYFERAKDFFDCPFENWPTIVSSEFVSESQWINKEIVRIFKKVLVNFRSQIKSYAALKEDNELIEQSIQNLSNYDDLLGLLLRLDLVISNETFKVIEINSGSSIGGWTMDFLEQDMQQRLAQLDTITPIAYRPILEGAMASLITAMEERLGEKQGNVFIYIDKLEESRLVDIKKIFEETAVKMNSQAQLIFFSTTKSIVQGEDGTVTVDGKKVGAMVFNGLSKRDITDETYLCLLDASYRNKMVFPDDMSFALFGAKHLFALVYEDYVQQSLSADERAFIHKYIPFTFKSNNRSVSWQGEVSTAKALLIQNKDSFVLKQAFSSSGKDVVIGLSSTDEEWENLVNELYDDEKWIAQQYFEPDAVEIFSYPFNMIKKSFVWGVFNFNTEYHGAFVRASFLDQDKVINSSRGAIDVAIFEESISKELV